MRCLAVILLLSGTAGLTLSRAAEPTSWPQFRGPDGTAVATEGRAYPTKGCASVPARRATACSKRPGSIPAEWVIRPSRASHRGMSQRNAASRAGSWSGVSHSASLNGVASSVLKSGIFPT